MRSLRGGCGCWSVAVGGGWKADRKLKAKLEKLKEEIGELPEKILHSLPFEKKTPVICNDKVMQQEVKDLVNPLSIEVPLNIEMPVDEMQSVLNSTFDDTASTSGVQGTPIKIQMKKAFEIKTNG